MEDIILKQKAFFDAGNTWDTRSRRAMLQILSNTVKEVCGSDSAAAAFDAVAQDLRRNLYKWTGTGRLRLLMSLFAKPSGDGPVPYGVILIDAKDASSLESILSALAYCLAAGNTAVVLLPASDLGETVRKIVDETFTDDYVATVIHDGSPVTSELDPQAFDFAYACTSPMPSGISGFLSFSKTPSKS